MPTPKCVKECNPNYEGPDYENDKHFGKSVYTLPRDEAKIQAELFENGSATASFNVYEDFLTYTGGVYSHTGGGFPLGGHAVKILGWGVENGTPYWLCANSWN
jgi:cathepsin B